MVALDVDEANVDKINNKQSPLNDDEIEKFLANKPLNLTATTEKNLAYCASEFVIVATATNYDTENNYFNTKSVRAVVKYVLAINPKATIVIKSTIPVGLTKRMREQLGVENIIFSPESIANSNRYWIKKRNANSNLGAIH